MKWTGTIAILMAAATSLAAQGVENSIPMEVIHGKPYVMAMVNGQGPFRFVVDTGTGGEMLVSPQLAERLGLPTEGEARLTDATGLGEQKAPIALVESIEVAGVEFPWIHAVEHRLPDEMAAYDGVLGFALFRNHLLTLDYPNQRLTLATGALAPDGGNSVLPFRTPEGVPVIKLGIGDLAVEAQLDSGGLGLSLPEQLLPQLKLATEPVAFANGKSLTTRYQVKLTRLAADIRVGEYSFARPVVEINPAFPRANFGAMPMENFALTFDQQNLLVRFDAGRKVLHLNAAPAIIHMDNTPVDRAAEQSLVPVG